MRAIVSEVPLMYDYSRCHNKARVDVALRVGMNVTVSVPSKLSLCNSLACVVIGLSTCSQHEAFFLYLR